MKIIQWFTLILLIIMCGFTTASDKHPVVAGPVPSQELTNTIMQLDKKLFSYIFEQCNTEELAQLITEDFEFYHDKWGQTADSKQGFLKSIQSMCDGQKSGQNVKASRELVEESVRVYPMTHFGAFQTGEHKFYGLGGTNKTLREVAKFSHLWKYENGQWRLARVISFDHIPAK